jgi:citrate synthase
MIDVIVAEVHNIPTEWVYGGGTAGVGGVLVYVGMRIGKLATRITALVNTEIERRGEEKDRLAAEAKHRRLQQHHWMVEERLMRRMAGIPDPDTGSHTPVEGIPIHPSAHMVGR